MRAEGPDLEALGQQIVALDPSAVADLPPLPDDACWRRDLLRYRSGVCLRGPQERLCRSFEENTAKRVMARLDTAKGCRGYVKDKLFNTIT
ncbi:hypothetical protein H0I76_18855 [Limibaculum sp. M0105]|uniref:Uncharacterized protein n=1 Tax=Thermohalobaculum xanthum TaxID=2753746 RepID=A0A8J7SIA5_9RHOB|nr:hypothetical protein [Thermohalobaculum xanthum]MBK0401262.1 hypothetical protein [Thermohalobaculum xanthum]